MYSILSIICGALLTFTLAPYYMSWLGFVSIAGLLLLMDKAKSNIRAFIYGFLFGFGHHLTGLYWISNSLLVEAEKFAWLIPFAVSIIPAYLSLYTGLICWLTKKLEYRGIAKILFFGGTWVMAEILRGHLFTGFPWNLAGYAFFSSIEIAQLGSIIGFYGMSLLAVFLFSTPYPIISSIIKGIKGEQKIYRVGYSIFFLLPISTFFIWTSFWGYERISEHKGKEEKTKIRIVQPNISQKEKFDPLRVGEHLYKYYSLTLTESKKDGFVPDIIVWPEAATPYNLKKSTQMLEELRDIIPYSSYLILGTVRYDYVGGKKKFYNSVEIVNADGKLEKQYYDKSHLVPFGEYMPFRKYLPGIEKITHGSGDFSSGSGPQTLALPNAPAFSPLICYEIIFPDKVVDKNSKTSAKWILNLTNDGWFGNSSGPYQHLDIARARAIEQGIPVVRAANTGISAMIDSLGIVKGDVGLNKEGVIDVNLSSALHFENFYSKIGIAIAILLAGIFMSSAGCLKFFYKPSA